MCEACLHDLHDTDEPERDPVWGRYRDWVEEDELSSPHYVRPPSSPTVPGVTMWGQPIDRDEEYDTGEDDDDWYNPNDFYLMEKEPSQSSQLVIGLGKLRRLGKKARQRLLNAEAGHEDFFEEIERVARSRRKRAAAAQSRRMN